MENLGSIGGDYVCRINKRERLKELKRVPTFGSNKNRKTEKLHEGLRGGI
jgi:hypothetical protein